MSFISAFYAICAAKGSLPSDEDGRCYVFSSKSAARNFQAAHPTLEQASIEKVEIR